MVTITDLSPGVWQISLPFQGEDNIVGSYLLAGKNELVIVDPGPGSMTEELFAAVRMLGFEPEAVTWLLITHVHLDHAGAAGSLVRQLPNVHVYAHSRGAPHLLDPSKIVASASRIFGERMPLIWGEVEAIPQERLYNIDGDGVLEAAGRRFEVYYTPGHASHHIIFFDPHSGELFAGDVAGVLLPGIDYVRPSTPPPDLDLEAWSKSIDVIKQLHPNVLYIGHFGAIRNPIQHLEQLRERLFVWGGDVLKGMQEGREETEIAEDLLARVQPELLQAAMDANLLERKDITTNYLMVVRGYMRYWRKKHPEYL
ncbi:MAG TPA: MBL fold metallo-hydrolase [Ktedonobacteraceae bacterium]|nr:MBL fold metallo-hydrolase [Ktedonobacteraceae bacterium]